MKINDTKLQEAIGWKPFPAQKEILDAYDRVRDIRLAAGTRFGKSMLCAYLALRELLKDDRHIWILAPTYDLAEKVLNWVIRFINEGFPELANNVSTRIPQHISTNWGSWIKCKSAENPVSLLGEELDLVIIDEASRIPEEIWQSYVSPRLTSRQGKSIMISTPKGQNWFYREWLRVKEMPDGFSVRHPTSDNPYIPKEEFERQRKILPQKIFQQEYEAVFLPESANIFGNIRDCVVLEGRQEYNPLHLYTMGIDLGRHDDFTVITVIDRMTNGLVDFHRFNEIDWSFQKRKIMEVADAYGSPLIYIDATSATVGDAFVTELQDAGYNCLGYKITTNISKRQLIEKLAVMLDNRQLKLYPVDELISELEIFTYEIMPSTGIIKYHAPQGGHDDCVISLALACWDLDPEPLPEEPLNDISIQAKVLPFNNQEF